MNTSPYSTDKLSAYPSKIAKFRDGQDPGLVTVHLMPQNLCNQNCSFCSYRMDGNKNASEFDKKSHIPPGEMFALIRDMKEMGVRGVELTGGGEPLAYPHIVDTVAALVLAGMSIGLVTNGTLLTEEMAEKIGPALSWARVSIDCSNPETYATMRRTKPGQFDKAWGAVELLRKYAPDDEDYRLGVGFVLSRENWKEPFEFIKMAHESGADNVRMSSTFHSVGAYFSMLPDHSREAVRLTDVAVEKFSSDTFHINNLMEERLNESSILSSQDYDRCPTKDLLCVVEGTGKVYTCCTFTGSDKGCYGNFMEHEGGFKGLWEEKEEWRKNFKACDYCKIPCLYRERNLAMNEMIDAKHTHKEFI
jgi:MoaA/NifB/PqqE/SkfB family radical SAM enzyme